MMSVLKRKSDPLLLKEGWTLPQRTTRIFEQHICLKIGLKTCETKHNN